MRKRLGILVAFLFLAVVLIALNAATYVQREKKPDTEVSPNRSTYNTGSTGSQAFFALLSETGRRVTRWRSPANELLMQTREPVSTFVMIGPLRTKIDESEVDGLYKWIGEGGKLVVIDRDPPGEIVSRIPGWNVEQKAYDRELVFGIEPADSRQMTENMPASRPVVPGPLMSQVNAVQTSRFAAHIDVSPRPLPSEGIAGEPYDPDDAASSIMYFAPAVLLSTPDRNIAVSFRYGAGSIVLVSDPYVVSNGGISLVDNLRFGVNLANSAAGGITAFDEYHQGYGTGQNRFLQYFAGTPMLAIFGQIGLAVGLLMISRSRRFARPVPEPEPDRLSKLEYIGAMAELQHRTRAYDVAVENIYGEFRRRVSMLVGAEPRSTGGKQLARMIAERLNADATEVNDLMMKCERIAHGGETSNAELLELMTKLREMEKQLGLTRTPVRRTAK